MQTTPDARVSRRFAARATLVLLLGLAAFVSESPRARALQQGIQGEGALANDAFLPASESATKELAAGDEALAKRDADVESTRTAAFEAWFRALAGTENGDCAPSSPRGTESIDSAVRRRIRAAGDDAISAWRRRFDEAATAALAAAGSDPAALARVARGFPLTRAAARAALALADLAQESGDPSCARTWLERARADGDPRGDPSGDPKDAALSAAIARRAAAFALPARGEIEAPWRSAKRLSLESQVAFEGAEAVRAGIAAGIAFLQDGRVCVQGAQRLHLVAPDGRVQDIEPGELARAHGWSWLPPFADRGERWPLLPAVDGTRIVIVAGRAAATHGNALLAIDASRGGTQPALAWGYSDAGFLGEGGTTQKAEDLLGPGLWEYEPGLVIAEGAVFVQAHQWTADGSAEGTAKTDETPSVDERTVRSWCLALDLETGRPRWKRLLAVGASDKARLRGARGFAHPSQPIALLGGQALVGTGIGVGARVDLCDGRIVSSWKFRRAPDGAGRWSLGIPLVGNSIAWAPPDSDRMYFLRPDPGGLDPVPGPLGVREIGDDVAPIATCGSGLVFLSRTGGRSTLARLTPETGARVDSVELPTGERFAPCGIGSDSRAIVAGDRAAYLFDLERDMLLLDVVPLAGREDGPEGAIAARGDRIYIAGERRLWVLKSR